MPLPEYQVAEKAVPLPVVKASTEVEEAVHAVQHETVHGAPNITAAREHAGNMRMPTTTITN